MQQITAFDKYGEQLAELVQWDKDITLYVEDHAIDKAYKVHFCNQKSSDAMVVPSEYSNGRLSVLIPNDLLTEASPITGYIHIEKDSEHRSLYCFKILIRKRPKPANYIYSDEKNYLTFEKVLEEAKHYAKTAQSYTLGNTTLRPGESVDNAFYYYQQAQKHAEEADKSETNAQTNAQNAKRSHSEAAGSATAAAKSATAAEQSAEHALGSANTASTKALEADQSVTAAESFAHGGTGTREKEETDNAKFYNQSAKNNSDTAKLHLEQVEQAGSNALSALKDALDMDRPHFQVDLSSGHLMYEGGRFQFQVNKIGRAHV